MGVRVCGLSHLSLPSSVRPHGLQPASPSVRGILHVRALERVACPPPGDLLDPGIEPAILTSLALTGGFFTTSTNWEAQSVPLNAIKKKLKGILDLQLLS